MADKPWNPRRLKNEIADGLREVHRLSCALAKESTAIMQNEKDAQQVDIDLMREGADDLKATLDRILLLWNVAGYPDEDDGVLTKEGLL